MPVAYILFTVMKILKAHDKKTAISKEILSRVIGEFLIESFLPDEVKDSLRNDYDFDYEIAMILDDYAGYLSEEYGIISLAPYTKIDTLDSLLEHSSAGNDDELISIIDDFYDFNIPVLEMIGIKMEAELYTKTMELEQSVVAGYEEFAISEICNTKISDKELNKLKKNIVKRRFLFNQLRMSLSLQEYNDLYRYSLHKADLLGIDSLLLKIEDEDMELTMETDPFHRALFFFDSNKELVFCESFYAGNNEHRSDEEKETEIFYTKVLEVIGKRINQKYYEETDEDLIKAKYRLMYVIDMLYQDNIDYNGYIFNGDRKINIRGDETYAFIEKEIFYLIDELLEYTDSEIANDIMVDLANNIKSILIETYYELTKDERIVSAIESHPNYGKHHFITDLFNNIIDDNKKKIKRKEDE